MKDAFKRPIAVGDTCAFNPPRYKGLVVGQVVAFTPKMVRVEYSDWLSRPSTTVVPPSDLVVKDPTP